MTLWLAAIGLLTNIATAQPKTSPAGAPAASVPAGWGRAVNGALALMNSQRGLGVGPANLPEDFASVGTADIAKLYAALGRVAVDLALARQAGQEQAALERLEFVRQLPEEFRKQPEAFMALPEGEQLTRLVIAIDASETASQTPRTASGSAAEVKGASRVRAALARARRALGSAPEEPAAPAPAATKTSDLIDAELDVLFAGAALVADRKAAPVGITRERADMIAMEQLKHDLNSPDPEAAQRAKNLADWTLVPRAKKRLRAAVAHGDPEEARRAGQDLGEAHALIAGAKSFTPPPVRIDAVLPDKDLGLRDALDLYLARALAGAGKRMRERGEEPLGLFKRLLLDSKVWTDKAMPALYDVLSMSHEWTNFIALAYIQAVDMIDALAGPEAVLRVLASAPRNSNRIPDGHRLAKSYFRVSDYFASFALRKALDSGSSRVLVDMGEHRLTLRRVDFSMTDIPGPSLTLTSIESLRTQGTDLDPEVLFVLEAVARERGFSVFQVEGVETQRDWDLLKSLGYQPLEKSDRRLRTYFKDLRPAT